MIVIIYPTHPHEEEARQGLIKAALYKFVFKFSFSKTGSHTKIKEFSMLCYLSKMKARIVEYLLLQRYYCNVNSTQLRLGFEREMPRSFSKGVNHYTICNRLDCTYKNRHK